MLSFVAFDYAFVFLGVLFNGCELSFVVLSFLLVSCLSFFMKFGKISMDVGCFLSFYPFPFLFDVFLSFIKFGINNQWSLCQWEGEVLWKFLVWFCLVSATTIVKRPPPFPKAKEQILFYQWFYETFLSMHTKCTNLLEIMCIERWAKRRNYLKSTLRTLLKFL